MRKYKIKKIGRVGDNESFFGDTQEYFSGYSSNPPTIGERFNLFTQVGGLEISTSPVTKIEDGVIKTMYSVYSIEEIVKVSIDFDGTLDRKDVQEYVKELINKGVEVWVCTFRTIEYDDELYKISDKSIPANSDLFFITDNLHIPRERIIFTEMKLKSEFLNNSFAFHLDDDYNVMLNLRSAGIKCVDVKNSSYKIKCNRILGL